MYYADIEIENKSSSVVDIVVPKGTVLEVSDLSTPGQCLVVASDVRVKVKPGIHKVKVPAYCLNRDQPAPFNQPGRLTPFVMRPTFGSQDEVWQRIGGK